VSWLGVLALVLAVVLLVPLLLVTLILASPLRVHGRADERGVAGGGSWFGVGVDVDTRSDRLDVRLLRWRLLRRPLRSTEPGADEEPPEEAAEATRKAERAKERPRRPTRRFTPMAWRRLARVGLRESRRTLALVHLDRLRLHGVIASEDPSLTGELYGFGCALTSALRGRWPEARVDLDADFVATRPRGSAELALRLRPIRLSGPAVRLGLAYLRERRRARRVA
jgi:hypothetical protein